MAVMCHLLELKLVYGAYKKGGKKRRLGYKYKTTLQYID